MLKLFFRPKVKPSQPERPALPTHDLNDIVARMDADKVTDVDHQYLIRTVGRGHIGYRGQPLDLAVVRIVRHTDCVVIHHLVQGRCDLSAEAVGSHVRCRAIATPDGALRGEVSIPLITQVHCG